MMKLINNTLHFLRNVWKWRHILWEDRDFDYSYLYDVLQFKLDNMYVDCMAGYTVNKGDYRYMKIASRLIDIVNNTLYTQEAWDAYPSKISPKDDFDGWLNEDNPERTEAIRLAMIKEAKAKRLLFKILEEKIDYWWD